MLNIAAIGYLTPRIPGPLDHAIARRARVAMRWFLKTGTMPPIQRQRVRWFREARDRRNHAHWDMRGDCADSPPARNWDREEAALRELEAELSA